MAQKRKVRRFYDYSLLFVVIFLTGFGLVMLYSASSYSAFMEHHGDAMFYLKRQAIFSVIGIVGMLVVSKVLDYHLLQRFNMPIYFVSGIFVILTAIIGLSSHGSTRWLRIGGINFQPSELMKIGVIVMLSSRIVRNGNNANKKNNIIYCLAVGLLPAAFIGLSNLSTGIIIAGITVAMIFIVCRNYVVFAALGGLVGICYIYAYQIAQFCNKFNLLKDYQCKRIFAWKDPASFEDATFQTLQGLYAIGSGGIFGKGLGESVQKFLMPEAQNDMIFTIICEELGLFGAVSLVILYLIIISRMLEIAWNAPDMFGSLLVFGIMCHISLQVILNIAVATNSIPNTGITLPFISYGGTSLILLLLEIGVCLCVSNRTVLER